MRTLARPSLITFFTMIGTALLSVVTTVTAAVTLTATALIVPGTGTPNANIVADYLKNADDYYIAPFNPACTSANSCTLQGIDYPAQFWPIPLAGWGGLNGKKWNVSTGEGIANLNTALQALLPTATPEDPVIMMGYSQGGNIVSRYKRTLSGLTQAQKDSLDFVMIGNTNRPNGGLFERLAYLGKVPILDATFGLPAPTNTGIKTTDIAFQYDGVADFPLYPLNVLADLNAIFGFWYIHGSYLAPNAHDPEDLPDGYSMEELETAITDPKNQRTYGDTTYVTIPTRTLPLVQPLLDIGYTTHTIAIMKPIADLISPVLRVLIDTGYNRKMNPGIPAPFELAPLLNPVALAVNLIKAAGQGVQAALNDITGHGKAGSATTPSTTSVPSTTGTAATPAVAAVSAAATTTTPGTLDTAPRANKKVHAQRHPIGSADQQPAVTNSAKKDRKQAGSTHDGPGDGGKKNNAKKHGGPAHNHRKAA